MTATQKYLFDLQGFLVVEDVLTDQECETAKHKIAERMEPLDKTPNGYDANGTWHGAWGLLDAGEPFTSLIDHPRLTEVLTEIIGPKLRLEITYSFVRSKGCPQFEMHGGHRGGRVNFRYHVQGDRIFTGLTVVSFTLQDIAESDGGFACIPGSHKCDFPVPEDHERLFAVDGPLATSARPRGRRSSSPRRWPTAPTAGRPTSRATGCSTSTTTALPATTTSTRVAASPAPRPWRG